MPATLEDLRAEARARAEARGLPTLRDEEWRYTSVRPIEKIPFRPAEPSPLPPALLEEARGGAWAGTEIVSVNGRVMGGGDEAEEIGRLSAGRTYFADFNTASFAEAAVVRVPAGGRIEAPVHVVHLGVPADGATVSYPRTLIAVGDGAEATVVETYIGGGLRCTNAVTEILVGEDAVLRHARVEREGGDVRHVGCQEIRAARGARVASVTIALGALLHRLDTRAVLAGARVEATLNGLYLGDAARHVDTNLLVEHAAPECVSREVFKGILGGRSVGVFQGRIHVHPGAQKTDAKQTGRALLLTPQAVSTAKPQLEIYADDVKCTHGATTGRLDDAALFYLRARGIDRAAAEDLLIQAFAGEILEGVAVEAVRAGVAAILRERLPGARAA